MRCQDGVRHASGLFNILRQCPQPLSIVFGWLPPLVLSPHGSFGLLAVFIGWRQDNRWQSICTHMARHPKHSSICCSLSVCSCGGCTHHQLSPLGLELTDSLHIPGNINPDWSGRIVHTLQALLIGLAADRFRAHSVLGGGGDGNPNLVQRPRSPLVWPFNDARRHSADMDGRGTFWAVLSRIALNGSECAARMHQVALCLPPSSKTKVSACGMPCKSLAESSESVVCQFASGAWSAGAEALKHRTDAQL